MWKPIEWISPKEIERHSMEIIEREMPPCNFSPEELAVVKRCIHTDRKSVV